MGLGLLAGNLVGRGVTNGYTYASWPALLGMALGTAVCLATRARQVVVALCGATVAVVTAVVTTTAVNYQRGLWPIIDDYLIRQYGSTTQAIVRVTVFYGVLIGVPCLLAAVMVTAIRRRYNRAAQQGAAPEERPQAGARR